MALRNDIVAWLKLRDVARFVRDAKFAEHSIKKLADAAKDGKGPLGALGGALGAMSGALPKARTETGILGLTLGSLFTIATLGAPIITSLGGAVVALAGSLGAAALGAGALGVAFAGAAIPLGAFGIVAAQAFGGFQKVNTAFQQWNVQVGMYGRNSTQAETALSRLNSVAAQFGGDTMVKLVQRWGRFQKLFRSENMPAIHDLIKMFDLFLATGEKLLPVISRIAKVASSALLGAFQQLADTLTSDDVVGILDRMGDTFGRLSGPLTQAVINILLGLLHIADRLAPALDWIVGGLEDFSYSFLNFSQTGPLNSLVDQFKSWWGLLIAVGKLLITILGGGAKQGKGLVDTLTHIVNRWNDFLNTAKGQSEMKKFFDDAVALTKDVVHFVGILVKAFFNLGRALAPLYVKGFKALSGAWHEFMDALKPARPFLHNVLMPLLKGIVKGILIGLVGAFKFVIAVIKIFATVLGFVGKIMKPFKGIIEAIGVVIGFVFGGEILDALKILGDFIGFFKPLGRLLSALGGPIRAAGKLVEWLGSKIFNLVERAWKMFPAIRGAIDSVLGFLEGAGKKFFDAGAWLWKNLAKGITRAIGQGLGFAADIGKAIYNFVAGLINRGLPNRIGPHGIIDLPNNPIPMLAAGGVVSGSGSWITGEMGPEINTLRNGKVTVVPLSPAVSAQGTAATLAPDEKRVMVAKVYLRGRQIAEAVADEAEDEQARK